MGILGKDTRSHPRPIGSFGRGIHTDLRQIHQQEGLPARRCRRSDQGSPRKPAEDQLRQSMKVAIVDYGMGNLGSVSRALRVLGAESFVAEEPAQLEAAALIILPGVGSFADGMARLRERGWVDIILEQV